MLGKYSAASADDARALLAPIIGDTGEGVRRQQLVVFPVCRDGIAVGGTCAKLIAEAVGVHPDHQIGCSLREKSASFKAWDLEAKTPLTVDDLKQLDWPNSRMAIVVQLSGVYFQASGFGAVIQLKSVGLRTASAECPFEFLEA